MRAYFLETLRLSNKYLVEKLLSTPKKSVIFNVWETLKKTFSLLFTNFSEVWSKFGTSKKTPLSFPNYVL